MTSESRDPELDALWAELDQLLPQGPSTRAEIVLQRLRTRAELMEAAGNPEAPEQLSAVLFSTGLLASMGGRGADAEAAYRAAIPPAERALAARPSDLRCRDRLASLHYNLGNIYSGTGRLADAEAAYRAALTHQEANVRDKSDLPFLRNNLAQTKFNLGNTCMSLKRLAEAAEWFRAARDLWQRLVEEEPSKVGHAHNLARSYFNFAYVAGTKGPSAEALDAYQHAQAIWERLLRDIGEDLEQRYDVARCYHNHSLLLFQGGHYEKALAGIQSALSHFDRLVELAPNNANFATLRQQAHQQREWLLANSPERVAAQQVAEGERRAALARAAGNWQQLRQLGTAHLNQARAFCQGNRPVEMEQVYRAALRLIAEAARFDPTPDIAHLEAAVWFDLNIDLRALGRYDGAEEAVRNALRRWQRLQERYPMDPRFRHWLAGAYNNLGIICADTGRSRVAEAAYHRALTLREEMAGAAPDNRENQLFLGGALCNLGNVYLDRGQLATARDFYERALRTIEPVQKPLSGNALVGQFLKNSRDGVRECNSRTPLDADRFASATMSWALPAPPPLAFEVADANLAAALRNADSLRLAGDIAAEQATADLVARAPDCAEAWFLRGLVLGNFRTAAGAGSVRWEDERHEEAIAAFYESLVCRPEDYHAKLYKGLALRQAAHAAQADLRALQKAVESLPESQREGHLAPRRRRFQWDVARARESLEAAARLQPEDGRAYYELAELYHELGYREKARPYLDRLRAVDADWWERIRPQFFE